MGMCGDWLKSLKPLRASAESHSSLTRRHSNTLDCRLSINASATRTFDDAWWVVVGVAAMLARDSVTLPRTEP